MDPLNDLRKERLAKLQELVQSGALPYAYTYDRTHLVTQILEEYDDNDKDSFIVSVSGRIMSMRKMGKASFFHILDSTGRIQVYIKQDTIGPDAYEQFKLLDLGDIIGIKGSIFTTKTGETTILAENLELLSKSLRPLPIVKEKIRDEKIVYDAFADKELRYRQRYVDLIVNQDVKHTFILRSRFVSELRRYLESRGYYEVETPLLQPLYGGAFARPFITHHNALDMDLYLRIADELYLKRLIVGGFDGVFEIAKDFRNEGMDRDHIPEFTMLELYVAFEDYHFMMKLVEDMVSTVCKHVLDTYTVTYQGTSIDLKPPWNRITMFDAIEKQIGMNLKDSSLEELQAIAKKLDLTFEGPPTRGNIINEIFDAHVQPTLIQPTFIIDLPLEISPLANKHRSEPGLVERFEGFIAGKEICNAYSELNDPIDQRERFEMQARQKAEGDEEAMLIDEDYLRAMEYGMPPTAGLGIGVDRLVMLLTDSHSIRDVVLFPPMRPESITKSGNDE